MDGSVNERTGRTRTGGGGEGVREEGARGLRIPFPFLSQSHSHSLNPSDVPCAVNAPTRLESIKSILPRPVERRQIPHFHNPVCVGDRKTNNTTF